MGLSSDAPQTPRDSLLRLGWWLCWMAGLVSAALHLLIGDLPGLGRDAVYVLIVLAGVGLNRWRPHWGVVLFYAALAPYLVWLAQVGGVGWVLTRDLAGFSAALVLPAIAVAVLFHFRGVVLFLLYGLAVGALLLPMGAAPLAAVAWYVLLALALGGQTAWVLAGADRAVAGLRRSAFMDTLTGLGNRRAFDAALDQAWAARREDLAVALLDLDGLKAVNDTRGHAAGDDLLMEFASALRDHLGPGDTAFRLGGDEYVVLCAADRLDAVGAAIAAAIRQMRQAGFVGVDASVGRARAAEVDRMGALVRLADERMYTEKRGKTTRGAPR